jgi:hypothetical protein
MLIASFHGPVHPQAVVCLVACTQTSAVAHTEFGKMGAGPHPGKQPEPAALPTLTAHADCPPIRAIRGDSPLKPRPVRLFREIMAAGAAGDADRGCVLNPSLQAP